jgi:hypothetical protein
MQIPDLAMCGAGAARPGGCCLRTCYLTRLLTVMFQAG